MGTLYKHYSEAPWDKSLWPNFSAKELACNHCGEYYHDEHTLNALQAARKEIGKPFFVNSGHRCWLHNARIGGAPLSQHKKIAIDISLKGHEKEKLRDALLSAGFTGMGFYATFIHVDMGRQRWWASSGGKKLWNL